MHIEALDDFSKLHQRAKLEPHRDLIGNVFVVDGGPVFIESKDVSGDEGRKTARGYR